MWVLVELDNHAQRAALSAAGWRPCGIVPDSERRTVAPGVVKYVPEAIYARSLVAPEALLAPRPEDMTPRVAALLALLDSGAEPPALPTTGPSRPMALDPAVAAELGPRRSQEWPDVRLLARQFELPAGVVVRAIERRDLLRLPALLGEWFPDTSVGSQAHLLSPDFYHEQVALGGEDNRLAERPVHGWVAEAAGEVLGAAFCSYDVPGSTLRCDFGAVDPRHRRSGLAHAVTPLFGLIGQAIQAETVVGWASMRHPATQRACERGGWGLWGIIPASERYATPEGRVVHAPEALYGFSTVPPEEARWPDRGALPPPLRALAGLVGGERLRRNA
jgi:hypothetical protein